MRHKWQRSKHQKSKLTRCPTNTPTLLMPHDYRPLHDMTKLKLHTPDLTEANIAKLALLFPHCVTESKDGNGDPMRAIDFDLLKQELSSSIVEGTQERYQLNWAGKKEALLTANAPIAKTLRPCRAESVDFDTTQNLYIEGDNLDALKLLQETYLNQVKMIYIDPPYNTGNDFIYEDDFAEDTESYKLRSNQADEDGNRLVANTESNGRFHSDWLSMMYARLRLARNLLKDDGVIFISIDDNEQANLKRLCDEVFGEQNFIADVSVQSNPRGRQSDTFVATVHDGLIIYARNIESASVNGMPLNEEQKAEFNLIDDDKKEPYRLLGLRQRGAASKRSDRPEMYFPIYVCPDSKITSLKKKDGWHEVLPKKSDGTDGRWMWGKEKTEKDNHLLVARLIARRNEFDIFVKDFLNKSGEERTRKFKSIWNQKEYNNQVGTQEVKALFNCDVASFPKSKNLLMDICCMGMDKNDIVLDFFSGSATTAHAVMQLNAEDGRNRKFIMVQLPEPCDEKSEAYKAGFATIAEIGKERIRRAGQKIKDTLTPSPSPNGRGENNAPAQRARELDIGFRVLKIDSSNMNEVYYSPDQTSQQDLLNLVDNIRADRSDEDLLFQVLLDWGVDLTLPIVEKTIDEKTVFTVADHEIVACFDRQGGITEDFIKQLTTSQPKRVVFCDAGFADDSVKINVEQLFKSLSARTEIRTI